VDRNQETSSKTIMTDKLAPSFRDGAAGPGTQSGDGGFEPKRLVSPWFTANRQKSALWIPGSALAFGEA
jgi:hypothetical protein